MKRIFILFICTLFVVSCQETTKQTWKITNDYIDRLEASPDKAREAVDAMNSNMNSRQEELNKIRMD
jgi:hypothetical protein